MPSFHQTQFSFKGHFTKLERTWSLCLSPFSLFLSPELHLGTQNELWSLSLPIPIKQRDHLLHILSLSKHRSLWTNSLERDKLRSPTGFLHTMGFGDYEIPPRSTPRTENWTRPEYPSVWAGACTARSSPAWWCWNASEKNSRDEDDVEGPVGVEVLRWWEWEWRVLRRKWKMKEREKMEKGD